MPEKRHVFNTTEAREVVARILPGSWVYENLPEEVNDEGVMVEYRKSTKDLPGPDQVVTERIKGRVFLKRRLTGMLRQVNDQFPDLSKVTLPDILSSRAETLPSGTMTRDFVMDLDQLGGWLSDHYPSLGTREDGNIFQSLESTFWESVKAYRARVISPKGLGRSGLSGRQESTGRRASKIGINTPN